MTIDVSNQALTFLLALVLGVALGVLYDFFKILRLVGLKGKIIVFFEDVVFFLIASISMFSFYMQVTEGKARIYPVIAAAIGFYIYFKTVEKPVFAVVKMIYKGVVLLLNFMYKYLVRKPLELLFKLAEKAVAPIIKFIHKKIIRNIIIFFKNLLQKKGKMVYNVRKVSKKRKGKGSNAQKSREEQDRKKVFVF